MLAAGPLARRKGSKNPRPNGLNPARSGPKRELLAAFRLFRIASPRNPQPLKIKDARAGTLSDLFV
jgi:hypothetical protein